MKTRRKKRWMNSLSSHRTVDLTNQMQVFFSQTHVFHLGYLRSSTEKQISLPWKENVSFFLLAPNPKSHCFSFFEKKTMDWKASSRCHLWGMPLPIQSLSSNDSVSSWMRDFIFCIVENLIGSDGHAKNSSSDCCCCYLFFFLQIMTQRKIDDLFSQKRSRANPSKSRDEFDDIFENTKRQRTNPKPIEDVFQSTSLRKKRSRQFAEEEENLQQKKFRFPETIDLLDMFNTRSSNQPPLTTIDHDFKVPAPTTQKKVQMFFDHTDLTSLREDDDESVRRDRDSRSKELLFFRKITPRSNQYSSRVANGYPKQRKRK